MSLVKQHILFFLGLLSMASCVTPIEIFESQASEKAVDHIGNFYSTSIYEDHMSSEIWTDHPECIEVKNQSEHVHSGDGALHIVWDKGIGPCDWVGMGFGWAGWTGKNFGSIYDRTAIRFRVKTEGKPMKSIPMAFGLESYDGTSAWVGFNSNMIQGDEIGGEWTDVIIPILAFNWSEMEADITSIKQLIMEFQVSGDIYMDDIEVIEHEGSLRNRAKLPYSEDKIEIKAPFSDAEAIKLGENRVYLNMDMESLYVNAFIKDETPMMNSKTGEMIWNGDALEIALSTDYEAPIGRNFYMTTDRHFGIRCTEEPYLWDWKNNKQLENCNVEVKPQEGGYSLSAIIPLSELDIQGFKYGELYGLEIAIDFGDEKVRTSQLRWNSTFVEGFNTNPSLWGEMRIIEQ